MSWICTVTPRTIGPPRGLSSPLIRYDNDCYSYYSVGNSVALFDPLCISYWYILLLNLCRRVGLTYSLAGPILNLWLILIGLDLKTSCGSLLRVGYKHSCTDRDIFGLLSGPGLLDDNYSGGVRRLHWGSLPGQSQETVRSKAVVSCAVGSCIMCRQHWIGSNAMTTGNNSYTTSVAMHCIVN